MGPVLFTCGVLFFIVRGQHLTEIMDQPFWLRPVEEKALIAGRMVRTE